MPFQASWMFKPSAMRLLVVVWLAVFCLPVRAQSSGSSAGYLIRAGKLFDSESGLFRTDMVILVKGMWVDEIKPAMALTNEDRDRYTHVVDLTAYTVMPGLIDSHTHLLNREVIYPVPHSPTLDELREVMLDGDAYRALYGASRAKAYLEHGILIVQDLGNSGSFADVALSRAIHSQLMPGPEMSCSGPGLAVEGAQFPGLTYKYRALEGDEYRIVRGPEDGIQAVRENVNQHVTVIKIYADNAPNNTKMSLEEIRAITGEAHRYNLRVTAHATNNESVWTAVTGGVNSIEHGYSMADSTMRLMVQRKVDWVATFGDTAEAFAGSRLSRPDMPPETRAKNLYNRFRGDSLLIERGMHSGLNIVCGSDDYLDTHMPQGDATKHVLIGYVEKGMTIAQALQTATINAARHFEHAHITGTIVKGELANIVAFGGGLDRDIRELLKTAFVMKDGVVYIDVTETSPCGVGGR